MDKNKYIFYSFSVAAKYPDVIVAHNYDKSNNSFPGVDVYRETGEVRDLVMCEFTISTERRKEEKH